MRIAFLGLGSIGLPMARHLVPIATTLTVWNRTREKADAFARETGALVASSPVDAARAADVIITCVPSSREVEALVNGPSGLLEGLPRGALLIDCTSGDPATSQRLAAQLAARGVGFLDAPVSGGKAGAEKGTLTVMCGGDEATFQRARPVLGAFGEKIVRCGPVGAGHALKAANQALLAVHIWSLAEALVTAAKAGVDPALALDVINASSGRSNASMSLFPERVLTRAFPRTFKLALLDKDIGIAAELARAQGVDAPIIQLAARLMRTAHDALGDEADHVEAVKLVEQQAAQEIR